MEPSYTMVTPYGMGLFMKLHEDSCGASSQDCKRLASDSWRLLMTFDPRLHSFDEWRRGSWRRLFWWVFMNQDSSWRDSRSWRLFMSLHEDSSSRLLRACRGWHKDSCGAYSKGSCLIEFVKSKWWRRRCIVLWAASILLRRLVEVATHEHTNTMTRHPRTHQHNNLSPTITVHRLCTSRNESCRYHELNQSRTFLKAPQESPRGCHPRTQYIFLHITQWVVRISQPESVTNWIIHKLFTGPARGRGCHPRTQCIVLYITQKVI